MAAREFSKISPAIWSSHRFRALSPMERNSMLYLLTNAHIDSSGCYRLPEGYACYDTGLEPETWRAHLKRLADGGLILWDEEAEWVLVLRWFKHNPPQNLSHATGTRRRIAEIESDRLREACEADFVEAEAVMLAHLEAKAKEKAEREAANSNTGVKGTIASVANGLTNTPYLQGGRR